jgi:hypothetical protein
VGSPLLGLPLGLMGWGNKPVEFWEKPEKEQVSLRDWKCGTSPGLDYFRLTWNRILVKKIQEECEAHLEKEWRLSSPRETCRALTVRESQQ